MAFSDFSYRQVMVKFGLINDERDWFGAVPAAEVSNRLRETLEMYYPLARAIGTEKALSEFLIAPVLAEARAILKNRVSLFSGIDFPAAPDQGLNGICDFLMSRSPEQQFVMAPVIAVAEAKNGLLKSGYGQCIAEMIGASIFNEREGFDEPNIYGAVTTGELWRFLQLQGSNVRLDSHTYHIEHLDKILGILTMMLGDPVGYRAPDQAAPLGPEGS